MQALITREVQLKLKVVKARGMVRVLFPTVVFPAVEFPTVVFPAVELLTVVFPALKFPRTGESMEAI